jgi:hypothetical protein
MARLFFEMSLEEYSKINFKSMLTKNSKFKLKKKIFELIYSIYLANKSFCELSFFSNGKMYIEYRNFVHKKENEEFTNSILGKQFNQNLDALSDLQEVKI